MTDIEKRARELHDLSLPYFLNNQTVEAWQILAQYVNDEIRKARIEENKRYIFVKPPNNSNNQYLTGWRDRNRYIIDEAQARIVEIETKNE